MSSLICIPSPLCQAQLLVPAAAEPVYTHSPVHQEKTGDHRVSAEVLSKYLQLQKAKQWRILRAFSVLLYPVGQAAKITLLNEAKILMGLVMTH